MYIYGKNVVREKLNTNDKIAKVYVSKNFRDQDILKQLKEKHLRINFLDKLALDRKVAGNHQGIILEVDEIETYSLDQVIEKIKTKQYPTLVMLDHLEDPHNFGAIIRTCEALGIDGIIIPNDRSVGITGTVVKTSAGAISYVSIIRVANLTSAIQKLKKNGFWIVGTDMNGEDYTKLNYQMPVCLIIGNEGHGMSKIVKENCDFIASIPMIGKINSLNASVSCGILLSEIVNKRCL